MYLCPKCGDELYWSYEEDRGIRYLNELTKEKTDSEEEIHTRHYDLDRTEHGIFCDDCYESFTESEIGEWIEEDDLHEANSML